MAHVEKRGPARWRARYRGPDGKERSRTFDRKVDADRFLAGVEGDKVRGTYIDPAAGRRLFGDYAAGWLAAQVHRDSTAAQVASHMKNHVLPHFADRPLVAVRPSEVQAWVKGRAQVLAPATVEVVYRYLAAIFRAAVADQLIPSSPCRDVKLPKAAATQIVPLEVDHVGRLAITVPPRYRALIVLAAGTGMRQGEAFGLAVDRVDFLRRTVRVDQQLVLLAGRPPYLGPPKTEASYRTIPLPTVVVDALAAHLAEHEPGESGLVFTADKGGPLRRNRFSEGVWQPSVIRAGLPAGSHFHELRHFYASLLIRHGESVKTVQARLGHASATETLDTYGHLWPDSDDRTREAVDLVLGSEATTPAALER